MPVDTKRTKIVATLGPSTSTREMIGKLIDAGMNVARINFSHGSHEQHAELFYLVKEEAKLRGCNVAILGDLCGPKIRTGDLGDGVELIEGQSYLLGPEGTTCDIPIGNEAIFPDLKAGETLLLDDGYRKMIIEEADGRTARCTVVTGGLLKSHKGVNLPGSALSLPALTPKDIEDLYFGLDLGIDYFALSFVQSPQDILDAKAIAPSKPIIAKIERPQAVDALEEILKVSDGFMVARGDLGVELGPEHVPVVQKSMIRLARHYAKPVITATQMLESMILNPSPTRAEVSDVANAVLDGTSAVMLSAETASGRYPLEAVGMLQRIITEVERNPFFETDNLAFPKSTQFTKAIARAAVSSARDLGLDGIVVFSQTGETAMEVSKFHPGVPVIALTSRLEVLDQLTLHWGVYPLYFPEYENSQHMFEILGDVLTEKGFARKGDNIVVTYGMENSGPGRTNTLKLHTL